MSTCPITVRPGQIIGWINGRPVRAIAGGSEPAGDPPPADPPVGDPPADPPAPPPPADPPADNLWDDPAKAKAEIERLRAENGKARTTAKATAADEARQKLTQDIGKALGLVKDDEKADPAKLTEQLTAAQSAHRLAQVELAVFRNASKHQGDPSALLDSRSFLGKVADLDPSAKDFATKVEAAIKDAVNENPKLKAGQVPGASSVDGPPGGERRSDKPKNLSDAIAGHYGTG